MQPRFLILTLAMALSAHSHAAETSAPSREHLAPKGMEAAYHNWHYTPVLKVGDTVIVSGIPASRGESYEEKIRHMFEALRDHLATAGATMADVVELTSFHTGPTDAASFQAEFARLAPIHKAYFPDHYPAWSAVGTTALLAPGAVLEMRAVAVIGSGKNPRAEIAQPAAQPKPAE